MGISQTKLSQPRHPYYPSDIVLTGYVPNALHFSTLLYGFGAAVIVLFIFTYIISKWRRPNISTSDILKVQWFVLCKSAKVDIPLLLLQLLPNECLIRDPGGSLHVAFEGYYIFNSHRILHSQSVLAQLWKEYAFGDSRYLTQSSMVLVMEFITVVFWGPMCLATAYAIVEEKWPRFALQMCVSLAHMYGDMIYYGTSLLDLQMNGVNHSRPESLYFWGDFVGMNAPWIIVPACR